jgi:hypothetical protein
MHTVTLTFTDRQWAGVQAARELFNAEQPAVVANPDYDPEVEGSPATIPNPALIETNEAYVAMVMVDRASNDYAARNEARVAEILADS